jgi:hypothetical protein
LNVKLGELLCEISNIAISIRMNSKYNPSAVENPNTTEAVMWLSDTLHYLDVLGRAITKCAPEQIVMAVDSIIGSWEYNLDNIEKASLENVPRQLVKINESIEILNSIKMLVQD